MPSSKPWGIAYAAGVFDASGRVQVSNTRRGTSTALQIRSRRPEVVEEVQRILGGRVASQGAALHVWTVTGEEATDCAGWLLPYTVEKAEQLRIFLELRRRIENSVGWLRGKDKAERRALVEAFKDAGGK